MSMWHIQEIGAVNQNQRPTNEERVVSREVGSISIQKVKSRGIRRPRANKKNVTDNIGTVSTDGSSDAQDTNKKKPRKHEQGIQPRLYNPLSGDVPAREFAEKLNENLKNINSDALICKILSDDINWDDTIETKYGQFPKTSTVAIQQKINVHSTPAELDMIIPHEAPPPPPPVSLPSQQPPQPPPQPPNSCSHNMMAMNQPQNFTQNIIPPAIPNQSDHDFYHNLHIRPSMQDHGYDYGRPPVRNENDQIIVWNNYKNN